MESLHASDLISPIDLGIIKSNEVDLREYAFQIVTDQYKYYFSNYWYYLKKEQIIGKIYFVKPNNQWEVYRHTFMPKVIVPEDGYYCFHQNYSDVPWTKYPISLFDKDLVICEVSNDVFEIAHFIVEKDYNYTIIDDIISGERRIEWKNRFHLRTKDGHSLFVILQNTKNQFIIQYHKTEFATHKFKKGDVFHFVFSNGAHLQYSLKASQSNTNNPDFKQVSFSMLPQDIELFATESITAIRCAFENEDAPLDLYPENEIASLSFKFYFQKYKQALSECGVDLESQYSLDSIREEDKKDEPTWKESSCFVYLMKDESNGFYKIGISNKPEYRERTLQSEKPTIVLLKSKEFPTRTIAEAIESALHKAYGEKRLRGEWFELDGKDVENIVVTLS
jgi:hypothetical protein